ncbi:MAG: hypothetical protein IPL33_20110 [Sphingobacteriales bacterium]|nr:hypothetical protein [Sphingobacteriales bacterium]
MPIPKNISKNQESEIIKLVEQLLQLNKDKLRVHLASEKERIENRILYAENKINQLVYDLYELTTEERQQIEAS